MARNDSSPQEHDTKTLLRAMLSAEDIPVSPSLSQWFDPLEIHLRHERDRPTLLILFPHAFFASWFENHGKKYLEQAVYQLFAGHISLSYHIRGEAGTRAARESVPPADAHRAALAHAPNPSSPQAKSLERSPQHARLLASDPSLLCGNESGLSSFLCAQKNRFILDILEKSAQGQGNYSPVLLRGATGTGKTLLLKIMALSYARLAERAENPGDVIMMHARDFTARFAPGFPLQDELRASLRHCSAFCLDDVHLLQDSFAQTELCALIEYMHGMKRPLLLTANNEPEQGGNDPLSRMKPALFSRLCMGVTLELSEPDIEVKMRYAQDLLLKHSLGSQRELALKLARHCAGFRQIQGVLARISAFFTYSGQLPDEHDLDIIFRSSGSLGQMNLEAVLAMVATRCGYSTKDLRGKKRNPGLVEARQIAMYLCRELFGESYPALGRIFGNKDHSTVIHAVKKIRKKQVENKDMHNLVTELTQSCRQHLG